MRRVILWSIGGATVAVVVLTAWSIGWPGEEASLSEAEKEIFYADHVDTFGEDPATDVRYQLRAIRPATGEREAAAVIEKDGAARRYREGQFLEGSDTRVHQVFDDAVLLDRSGFFSLLWDRGQLDDGESYDVPEGPRMRAADANRENSPAIIDKRGNTMATRIASDFRERLYSNPLSLVGTIEVDVKKRSNGDRVYRLSPGRESEAFRRLGLKRGDKLVAINGIGVNEIDAWTSLYEDLADASHVTATLKREGRPVVVLLDLEGGIVRSRQ